MVKVIRSGKQLKVLSELVKRMERNLDGYFKRGIDLKKKEKDERKFIVTLHFSEKKPKGTSNLDLKETKFLAFKMIEELLLGKDSDMIGVYVGVE